MKASAKYPLSFLTLVLAVAPGTTALTGLAQEEVGTPCGSMSHTPPAQMTHSLDTVRFRETVRNRRMPALTLDFVEGLGEQLLSVARAAQRFSLYTSPGSSHRVAHVPLKQGQLLKWKAAKTLVYRYGEAEIVADNTMHEITPLRLAYGKFIPAATEMRTFEAGDRLAVIAPASDGYQIVRFGGAYMLIFAEKLRLISPAEVEQWILLDSGAGRSGWTKLDREVLEISER